MIEFQDSKITANSETVSKLVKLKEKNPDLKVNVFILCENLFHDQL